MRRPKEIQKRPVSASKYLATLPVLAATQEAEELTRIILTTGLIPPRATRDAAHIAFAAVHEMDFLLTWNCRHIHNAMISRRLAEVCAAQGYNPAGALHTPGINGNLVA